MTSRERLIHALNHTEPDKVPFDLGATAVSGISASALYRLRTAVGSRKRDVRVTDPFQILGDVDEQDVEDFGIDVVGISGPTTFFGYKNENWKDWVTPDGIPVKVGGGFEYTVDEEGNQLIYPKGDRSAAPSAKLPKGGYYFDALVRQEPIDEENMKGREDFREQFQPYDDETLEYYRRRADQVASTSLGAICNFGGGGLGDVAFLPGPGLVRTPGIRSVPEWYMAHLLHPEYIHDVYAYQTEVALINLELLWQAVGGKAQAIFLSGTDFGTQRCEFISTDMFRTFYKPYFQRLNDWVHRHTSWKTFYHTCGSVVNLLDDLVDCGVDILNPVQCSAAGMTPSILKEKYGKKLVFWGGGAETQTTLSRGTPEEVREEVKSRIATFKPGGGFVFTAVHNIQRPTPVANMLAMLEALKETR